MLLVNNLLPCYSLSLNKLNTLSRNVQKFLSNKLPSQILFYKINHSKREFSSLIKANKCPKQEGCIRSLLNPWWVTGFVDGEGCFTLSVVQNKSTLKWIVQLSFQIAVHKKDLYLLKHINNFFGVGTITKQRSESINYRVRSVKDLAIIISHFEKYPLLTHKYLDYKLFKKVVELIQSKEHLTTEGLQKIVAIKASMNTGLSGMLKTAFSDITTTHRPLLAGTQKIVDLNWLAGFTSAEGSFMVKIAISSSHRLGFQVKLVFALTQHIRDELLMRSLTSYLDCGLLRERKGGKAADYQVEKLSDLADKILPFFYKYPILGIKYKDFEAFCKVVELMKNKAHLTEQGLYKIRKIKASMNRGR